jgi:hypothetical protein
MPDFVSLQSAMHRAVLLAAGACLALLTMTIASLAFAFTAAGNAREVGQRMPVLVVPGAVGGVYSPGITEESVRATARYLANLATNFGSPRSFQERFDELESFSSATYLPRLQRARAVLQRDVETQNQARSFYASPATEQLHQTEPGRFDYAVEGERIVYASGLPMDTRRSLVHLRLQWGVPSARNRAGIVLESVDVTDKPASAAKAAASAQP